MGTRAVEFCSCDLRIRAKRRDEVGERGANMTDLLVGRIESGDEGGVGSKSPKGGLVCMCSVVY